MAHGSLTRDRTVPATRIPSGLARGSRRDAWAVALGVFLPLMAQGVIQRRARMVRLAARFDLDRRAANILGDLRRKYGPAPLMLRFPGRRVAVVLDPADVRRVLAASPEPFAAASREKVAALRHFQPDGVLISRGAVRARRRRFNEEVLETGHPTHSLAASMTGKIRAEADLAVTAAERATVLDWEAFSPAHWRLVRRVVLGDGARDDHLLTDLLTDLRADANWAYLKPRRDRLRRRFAERLAEHLSWREPGSLAEAVSETRTAPDVDPYGQVPQWLFAFDGVGATVLRTMAMLATHPSCADRVNAEIAGRDLDEPQDLPFLRACVQETLRLWPTTLAVLRDSEADTLWLDDVMPAGTTLVVVSAFFHRDESLPAPDRFVPDMWLDGTARQLPGIIPFSSGPVACPGRDLALFTATTLIAAMLEEHSFDLIYPKLDTRSLPLTFNHVDIALGVHRRHHPPDGPQENVNW